MNWREENITEKQKATIIKMQGILDWTCKIPTKRGEACDRIKELMKETDKRIAVTGTMKYNPKFDIAGDNEFDNDVLDTDIGYFDAQDDDDF
jgi:hypothetical protein